MVPPRELLLAALRLALPYALAGAVGAGAAGLALLLGGLR